MVVLLAALAHAAPVVCDPIQAQSILIEAKIDESRVSQTHPWLIPGLALASPHTDENLRVALSALCEQEDVLVTFDEPWQDASWSAHILRVSNPQIRGCTLYEESIALTVGRHEGSAPSYHLLTRLPWSLTPVGDCDTEPTWREETVLGGESSPVRLVLAVDRKADTITHSEIILRRATPQGWRQQVLQTPAPPRLLGGFSGSNWRLTPLEEDWAVVASHHRTGSRDACEAGPDQRTWTWNDDAWVLHKGHAARNLLAEEGLWRFISEDGWLLILAQDTDDDAEVLDARRRRLMRRQPGELLTLDSASLPGLNPGYLVVTPPPFVTSAQAEDARDGWRRRSQTYIKQAWTAVDACEQTP